MKARAILAAALACAAWPADAAAQSCGACQAASLPAFDCSLPGSVALNGSCLGLVNCVKPTVGSSRIDVVPLGGGSFEARLVVPVTAQANGDPNQPDSNKLQVYWTAGGTPMNPTPNLCQNHAADKTETYLRFTVNCAGAPYDFGTYSLRAVVCEGGGSCQKTADAAGLSFRVTKAMLGCPEPPKHGCNGDADCKLCRRVGPGGASVGGGGGAADPPQSGPKALLRYRAGGAGGPGWPGTGPSLWNQRLGRYWSHDHAERIVLDPDISHVWLITKYATFREWSGLAAAGPRLRPYATNSPSDEKRQLSYDDPAAGGTGGWQLRDLDGTVDYFLASGLWDRTVGRNPANVVQGSYSGGALSMVTFPDGRNETYTYDATTEKLASITEHGVGGAASRTWIYQWTGDDLLRIGRPDGTAYEFFYSTDPNFPGYLTRIDLVGNAGGVRQVEVGWSYDASGNVAQIWRGDPDPTQPQVADRYQLSYDNLQQTAQTTITDAFGMPAVYSVARDVASLKPKVTAIQGDCPTCGVGPNVVFEYNDPANPLLPTAMVDGRGLRTEFAYDAYGQVTRKSEAVGTALARDTLYQYDATFHSFPTLIDQPSTSGGAARRQTAMVYDVQGNLMTRTITGAEGGSAFSYQTAMTYNGGGALLTTDPPGYGTADVASLAYDATRGNGFLVPQSRTDPIVGTTHYGYDAYNRRTSVIDVNGVETQTTYDALDRVTGVTQKGATSADDLATVYAYDPLGQLVQTTLPAGNVVAYGYDSSGRLVTVERKPNAATPGERALYTLDHVGHRTKEELQRWTGSAWSTEGETDYVYSGRCHLDKTIRPDGSTTGAVTEYAYDCDDNLAKVWDARHPSNGQANPATQAYSYDALNRLTSIAQPWAGAGGGTATTSYSFDVQDHLASVTDANGNVTSYLYGDRDLLTRQVSPVSGETDYAYNAHALEVSEVDARGIATSRTLDALDRVTAVTYPDSAQNVTMTYDAPGSFAIGRLTGISRHGQTVAYGYDRFGRTVQDGQLAYTLDKNGNRTAIGYPGGVTAAYTFDFADREATLSLLVGTNPPLGLAGPAAYEPFGPLASLALGNGLTETRTYDTRYLPKTIRLDGASTLLNWSYGLDPIGNVSSIADLLSAANNRTYGYLDVNYFLTQGDGPWGTRAWTYDKAGNRVTETRSGITDSYTYLTTAGATTAKLGTVALGGGGTRRLGYDAAGNTLQETDPSQQLDRTYDASGRLSHLRALPAGAETTLAYDGRGFLSAASQDPASCLPTLTQPIYSSEGRLEARAHFSLLQPAAPASDSAYLLYFAGRPLATYQVTGHTSTLLFLTTDHLGTPALATRDTGAVVWQGGFEPFGADWSGAGAAGVFLRFPGQWTDSSWRDAAGSSALAYNLNRWYGPTTSLYSQPDPLTSGESLADQVAQNYYPFALAPYGYADANPVAGIDPSGLARINLRCALRWFITDTVKGALAGAAVGCAGGGLLAAPGGVTIPVGCLAGAGIGANIGVRVGAIGGAIHGVVACQCADDDEDEREKNCDARYRTDLRTCNLFSAMRDWRRFYACRHQAETRYAECLRHGRPLSPLSPSPFDD